MLREACRKANESPIDLNNDKRFTVWEDAFQAFGADAKRFAPAHLALRKRVQRPGSTFPFINKAVAVMNLVSIEKALPVGGDDMLAASKSARGFELRFATGEEEFEPLGEPNKCERPEPGEVIYGTNGMVMCRRWCWRNAHTTRITEDTTVLLMNTDGLGVDSERRAVEARDFVAALLEEFCGASDDQGIAVGRLPRIRVCHRWVVMCAVGTRRLNEKDHR